MTIGGGVRLRLYSGIHMGAEIALTEGLWVFGRDDSCDIVLADPGLAPRHAVLDVKANALRFENLDGRVETPEGEAPASAELEPGRLWRMGPVLFAWAADGAAESLWEAVDAERAKYAAGVVAARAQTGGEEKAAEAHAGGEKREVLPDGQAAAGASGAAEPAGGFAGESAGTQGAAGAAQCAHERSGLKTCAVVLLALLLGGIAALANDSMRLRTEQFLIEKGAPEAAVAIERLWGGGLTPDEKKDRAASIAEALVQAGFSGVRLDTRSETGKEGVQDDGLWRLTGAVTDDRERGRLVRFARSQSVPLAIDVRVESDATDTLAAAFNALGFWPEVTVERQGAGGAGVDAAQGNEVQDALVVAGYMRTASVEEKAFADVRAALPGDGSRRAYRLERRIRHESDLAPRIDEALKGAGLQSMRVEYLPGALQLRAATAGAPAQFDRAVEVIRTAVDVPLRIERGAAQAEAAPEPPQKAATAPVSGGPDFHVTAVSGSAMKFVTLSTGEKVFTGGRLPGGYTLEAISAERLVLVKDNKRIVYPLKLKENH